MSSAAYSVLAVVNGLLMITVALWRRKEFSGWIFTTVAGVAFAIFGFTGLQPPSTTFRVILVVIPLLLVAWIVVDRVEKRSQRH